MLVSTTKNTWWLNSTLLRPAEVDVLLGNARKARETLGLGADRKFGGDDRRNGGGRPGSPPRTHQALKPLQGATGRAAVRICFRYYWRFRGRLDGATGFATLL